MCSSDLKAKIGTGAGGIAFGNGSAAAGAAVSVNTIHTTLRARIEDSTRVEAKAGSVDLLTTSSAKMIVVALGVAGGSGSFALGGSVIVNTIGNTIDSHVKGSTVVASAAVTAYALDRSEIDAGSGGIAVGAKASVGASFATNNISNTVTAYAQASTITATAGAVDIKADSNARFIAVSLGGGVTGGNFALGGSVSLNSITNTTDAHISAASVVTSGGSTRVRALDQSYLYAGSGGFAVAGTVAVGAAISEHDLADTVRAYIDSSDVTSNAGDVEVLAKGNYEIISATVAGGASSTVAVNGSIGIHSAKNSIQAYVSGSTTDVVANGSVTVQARHDLLMGVGVGAIGAVASTVIGGDSDHVIRKNASSVSVNGAMPRMIGWSGAAMV